MPGRRSGCRAAPRRPPCPGACCRRDRRHPGRRRGASATVRCAGSRLLRSVATRRVHRCRRPSHPSPAGNASLASRFAVPRRFRNRTATFIGDLAAFLLDSCRVGLHDRWAAEGRRKRGRSGARFPQPRARGRPARHGRAGCRRERPGCGRRRDRRRPARHQRAARHRCGPVRRLRGRRAGAARPRQRRPRASNWRWRTCRRTFALECSSAVPRSWRGRWSLRSRRAWERRSAKLPRPPTVRRGSRSSRNPSARSDRRQGQGGTVRCRVRLCHRS